MKPSPKGKGTGLLAAMAGRHGAAAFAASNARKTVGFGADVSMSASSNVSTPGRGGAAGALTAEALAQRNGEPLSPEQSRDEEDVIDELAFDDDNNQNNNKRGGEYDDDDDDEMNEVSKKNVPLIKRIKHALQKCYNKYFDWGDGLPCGLSMTTFMAMIILVPIVFLVTYTSIPLHGAVTAQSYIANHKIVITDLVKTVGALERERRDSSLLIADEITNGTALAELRAQMMADSASLTTTTTTSTTTTLAPGSNATSPPTTPAPPMKTDPRLVYDPHYPSTLIYFNRSLVIQRLEATRNEVDEDIKHLLSDMLKSDSEAQQSIISQAEDLLRQLSVLRERFDARKISGADVRDAYKDLQAKYALKILELNREKRAETVELLYMLFMLMLRNENNAAMMRDVVNAIILERFNSTELIRNLRTLQASVENFNNDLQLIEAGGHAVEFATVQRIRTNDNLETVVKDYQAIFAVDGNISKLNFTFFDQALAYDPFVESLQEISLGHLDYLNDGKDLRDTVIEEVLKMVFAVIACILTAALVIWLNHREQRKMDRSLKDTRVLARAVQKFVPKNQLKMMGVKSITEVHPGLTKDVSRTLLSSSIRDFTKLAEEMESQDLFEWLQRYVSRMTNVVVDQKGYIDTLVGDSILSVFVDALPAVDAAINMHVSTEQLNLELVAQGIDNLVYIGVGIHFCEVVAGVFGDNTRLSCTMVSSDVNLAGRLENLSRYFGAKVVASAAVIGQIDMEKYCVRCIGKVPIAGSNQTVILFDVFQSDPVDLKKHKTTNLKQFEKAVRQSDKDPEGALMQFEHIAELARKAGVIDIAAERRKQAGGGIGDMNAVSLGTATGMDNLMQNVNMMTTKRSSAHPSPSQSALLPGSLPPTSGGSPTNNNNNNHNNSNSNTSNNNNNQNQHTNTSSSNSNNPSHQQQHHHQQNQHHGGTRGSPKSTPSGESYASGFSATSGVLRTPGNESAHEGGSSGGGHQQQQQQQQQQPSTLQQSQDSGPLPHSIATTALNSGAGSRTSPKQNRNNSPKNNSGSPNNNTSGNYRKNQSSSPQSSYQIKSALKGNNAGGGHKKR